MRQPACTASSVFHRGLQILGITLGGALVADGVRRRSPLGAMMAVFGGTCLLRAATGSITLRPHLRGGVEARHGVKFETSITLQQSPGELYGFWRKLENLPQVMSHLRSVEDLGRGHSRWVADAPLGQQISWEAVIINDHVDELIAWESVPGSMLATAGSVHFTPRPHDRGTMITVSLKYDPPAGRLGATLARWLGSGLERQVDDDLRKFKQRFEAGEVARVEGQPQGWCSSGTCSQGGAR